MRDEPYFRASDRSADPLSAILVLGGGVTGTYFGTTVPWPFSVLGTEDSTTSGSLSARRKTTSWFDQRDPSIAGIPCDIELTIE